MNKTNIEWTDYTWNPVSGCLHPCRNTYCYNTMKRTSYLNRFGARYRENSEFRYEKNWKSRQTVKCHTAQKGEVYPYGLCQNTLHKIKLKSYHPIFIETWRDTHKMI